MSVLPGRFCWENKKKYVFQIGKILKILNAPKIERENYEIFPSRYGIHWSLLDGDLSIDGLLNRRHTPSQKKKMVAI